MTSTVAPAARLGSTPVDVAWTAVRWPGCEHVIASCGPAGFRADSLLILASEAGPATVSYQLRCDTRWQVTALTIRVTHATSDRTLSLRRDTAGLWKANGNRSLPDLDGCIDVDIDRSPLTNTVPIRRLAAGSGAARDLDVAYVSVPEMTVRPVRQRYTRLAGTEPIYRYESGSFGADLPVDADGFVIDYPGLWRRIGPDNSATAGREPAR